MLLFLLLVGGATGAAVGTCDSSGVDDVAGVASGTSAVDEGVVSAGISSDRGVIVDAAGLVSVAGGSSDTGVAGRTNSDSAIPDRSAVGGTSNAGVNSVGVMSPGKVATGAVGVGPSEMFASDICKDSTQPQVIFHLNH